ncbi:MAG TPA: PAS domain-containing protein [Syntrophomonadaceae bacterium]|nr:PAS domain-containing protein [Syntrophomonadaceae bacterium]
MSNDHSSDHVLAEQLSKLKHGNIMNDGLYILDEQFRFTYISPRAEPHMEKPLAELLGRCIWEALPAYIGTKLSDYYHEAAANRVSINFEFLSKYTNKWYEINVSPGVPGIYVNLRDISQRHEYLGNLEIANQALEQEISRRQAAERQLEMFFNISSDLFVIATPDGLITQANPEFSGITNYTGNEGIAQIMDDKLHPDDFETAWTALQEVVEGKSKQNLEMRYLGQDGSYRWVSWNLVPIAEENLIFAVGRDVSNIKRAQEELVKSRRDMGEILDSISDPFFVLDNEWHFRYVNRQFARSVAWMTEDELLGENIWSIFPKAISTEIYKFCNKAMKEKVPGHFLGQFTCDDAWFDFSVYPFYNGLSICCRDVSDRIRLEQQLHKSEERFQSAVENMMDSFGIYTAVRNQAGELEDFRIDYVNEAACNNMHMTKEELLGHRMLELFPAFKEERFLEYCELLKNGKRFYKQAAPMDYLNQGQRYIDISAVKIGDGFAVAWRVVTERIEKENALRQSEERFCTAFHSSPVMMAIISMEDDRFIEVNQTYLDAVEFDRQDILGHTERELNLLVSDTLSKILQNLRKSGKLSNIECEMRARSGKILSVFGSMEKTNINGELCRLIVAQDVSKEKELDANLARLDRLGLIGEMAASIGHEIRNPMTAVRGFLQMLAGKESYINDQMYFQLMIEELDRANSIITDFLSLARNKPVDLKPHYIDKVIKAMYPMMLADANYQEMQIKMELAPTPPVRIDEKEIRQLILNLVRNGLEAMSAGGILSISSTVQRGEVILSIKDQGTGIPSDLLDKIGTPFVTTKENGTGLGLAVCYSIAARHEARVKIDTSSKGTTFNIYFPIVLKAYSGYHTPPS